MSFALTIDQNESVNLRGDDGESIATKPVPISGANPGSDPVFVFRPGGVGGGNVYTTQATLRTAMLATSGPKTLQIDGTGGGPTSFSGVVDFLNQTTLVAQLSETLTFAAGATLTGITQIAFDRLLFVQNTGTVVWTVVGTPVLYLNNLAGFGGSAGAAFVTIPPGTSLGVIIANGGGIGDTLNAAISGSGLLGMNNISGVITANAIGAGLTWDYAADGTGELDFPQGSTPVFTYFALPNILQELDAAGHGAAATVTSNSTGTLRQTYSGRVTVRVQASFTQGGGAPGNTTMSVQRDGVTIAGAPTVTGTIPLGSIGTLSVEWVDTLPDVLPHHYGWTATTSAGTIAVAGGQASIKAIEEK